MKRYRVRVTALDENGGEDPKIRPGEFIVDSGQTISLRAEDLAVEAVIFETDSLVEGDPFPGLHEAKLEDLIVESPNVRKSDPWTSHEAAREQTPRKNGPLHAAILLALYWSVDGDRRSVGRSDEWLIDTLGGPESSIQTRRHELQVAGLVEATGETKSRWGKPMIEWSLSTVGEVFVKANSRELIELRDRRRSR